MRQLLMAFLVLSLATTLNAIRPEEAYDTKDVPRIMTLLPNLLRPLAVEPAIPAHFIAMSPDGTIDFYEWVYWGPQDVLEAYFKDPRSLKEPILRMTLSPEIVQSGPSLLDKETEEQFKALKKEYPKAEILESHWGEYPVLTLKIQAEGKTTVLAWVGVNDPESGSVLKFNLVYPETRNHPTQEELAFWDHFIANTKQLTDAEFFKANGQDLQPGYTIVSTGGAKVKMTAEKRERDGQVQVVVIPVSANTEFKYSHISEGPMGARWNYGHPLVKVYGSIIRTEGDNWSEQHNCATSVLVQTVAEFSVDKEQLKGRKDLFVYQN